MQQQASVDPLQQQAQIQQQQAQQAQMQQQASVDPLQQQAQQAQMQQQQQGQMSHYLSFTTPTVEPIAQTSTKVNTGPLIGTVLTTKFRP